MYNKTWLIIRDDAKKTFEVCDQSINDNSFVNLTIAMQRAGMAVSGMTPPVTNKTSSKEKIEIAGYAKEKGLFQRLQKQFREITLGNANDFEQA